jgi:uncharacterized membrane protein YfcA
MPLLLFIVFASLGVLVGTVVGFASALVAMPLLVLVLPPELAIPAFTGLTLFMNLVVVVETRRAITWRPIGLLIAAGVLGTVLGAWSLARLSPEALRFTVSVVTIGFGLLFLLRLPVRLPQAPIVDAGLGLLSGWLGGCIAQSGPPVVFLALARGWHKDTFRGNLMAYFFVLSAAAVLAYAWLGRITPTALLYCAAALVPAFLMSLLGVWIKNRINDATFRTVVLVVIILVGVVGLVRR